MAVLAPIPRPRVSTDTIANAGFFLSIRTANLISCQTVSIHPPQKRTNRQLIRHGRRCESEQSRWLLFDPGQEGITACSALRREFGGVEWRGAVLHKQPGPREKPRALRCAMKRFRFTCLFLILVSTV